MNATKVKVVRRISSERMRTTCIRCNWYDAGSNDEYGHLLFDLCQRKRNLTDDDVILIVQDIIEHTARFKDEKNPDEQEAILFTVSEEVFRNLTMYMTAEEV